MKKGDFEMKVKIDKTIVEFTPEGEEETKQVSDLWNLLVDCAKFNRKLVPIGEFIPKIHSTAKFHIED